MFYDTTRSQLRHTIDYILSLSTEVFSFAGIKIDFILLWMWNWLQSLVLVELFQAVVDFQQIMIIGKSNKDFRRRTDTSDNNIPDVFLGNSGRQLWHRIAGNVLRLEIIKKDLLEILDCLVH